MAQKVQVLIFSDLSEKEGASTVAFSFSGSTYEIDLTGKEQDDLAAKLQPYIAAGRRVSGRGGARLAATPAGPGRGRRGAGAGPDPRQVRDWAAKKGIKVSDRGRVPASVVEQYLSDTQVA